MKLDVILPVVLSAIIVPFINYKFKQFALQELQTALFTFNYVFGLVVRTTVKCAKIKFPNYMGSTIWHLGLRVPTRKHNTFFLLQFFDINIKIRGRPSTKLFKPFFLVI